MGIDVLLTRLDFPSITAVDPDVIGAPVAESGASNAFAATATITSHVQGRGLAGHVVLEALHSHMNITQTLKRYKKVGGAA